MQRQSNSQHATFDGAERLSQTLSRDWYTSSEVFAREIEALFMTHWYFVGRAEQLAKPNSYMTLDTPAGSIILARGADGHLRAFANTCRHRGCKLTSGAGVQRSIVCPYHGWVYDLGGKLRRAGGMEGSAGFDKANLGLIELPLEHWAGFCFVRFKHDGLSLPEHLGDMPEAFSSHKCEDLVCVKTDIFDLQCNWKLILENGLEDYHAGIVHRDSIGDQLALIQTTVGNWDSLYVQSDRAVGVLPGETTTFPFVEGLNHEARHGSYFTIIYPNTQFCFTQDSMWWLSVAPVDEGRSKLHVGYCFPSATVERSDFGEISQKYFKRWRITAEEDNQICEMQQLGLASPFRLEGPLGPREGMVEKFDNYIVRTVNQ